MRIWLGCVSLLLAAMGCSHEPPPPLATPAMAVFAPAPSSEPTAPPPPLIAVRVLTVAYQGARGAVTQRTRQQALERARMLVSMARSGEKLAELVGEYSDRPGANEDRGALRLRTSDPVPFDAALLHAALALSVGGVSAAVDEPEGFVIVERMPDPSQGPERIAAKHILIGYAGSPKPLPDVTRTEAEAQALADQLVAKAHEPNADWNALAAQYTDEPGSKTTGGDLGHFGRGQMVPAFERAAFALSVGEVSAVVKSPFGFHVIQRYE